MFEHYMRATRKDVASCIHKDKSKTPKKSVECEAKPDQKLQRQN